ncbi:MAG: ribosomal L7Ae/L30e/S12e/Gadd45 family protein [Candidatus Woesearchaeota archaeon]
MADDKGYEIVEIAKKSGKIKKGTNEVTKLLERGQTVAVVYASDVNPKEIVMHLPLLAKDKGIPCFEVSSKEELGAAAGLTKPTAAVAIVDAGDAKGLLKD